MPVKIDENTLRGIADATGGEYFRATDNQKLEEIYGEIDQLEKTKIEVTQYRKKSEKFLPWALLAIILVLAEFALTNSIYRSIA